VVAEVEVVWIVVAKWMLGMRARTKALWTRGRTKVT
jgi:hypothetical protein